jgi:hypothetical protein
MPAANSFWREGAYIRCIKTYFLTGSDQVASLRPPTPKPSGAAFSLAAKPQTANRRLPAFVGSECISR